MECWVTDTGYIHFCDGSVGDSDHSTVVMDTCRSWLGDHLNKDPDDLYGEQLSQIADTLTDTKLKDLAEIAQGRGDPRHFATKNWGWIAIRQNHVEAWELNESTLRRACRAIEEIWEEEDLPTEMHFHAFSGRRYFRLSQQEILQREFDPTPTTTPYGRNAAVAKLDKELESEYYQRTRSQ